jgi:hypothetical protein
MLLCIYSTLGVLEKISLLSFYHCDDGNEPDAHKVIWEVTM